MYRSVRGNYTLIQDVEDLQHKRESIWYSHDQDNEMGLTFTHCVLW